MPSTRESRRKTTSTTSTGLKRICFLFIKYLTLQSLLAALSGAFAGGLFPTLALRLFGILDGLLGNLQPLMYLFAQRLQPTRHRRHPLHTVAIRLPHHFISLLSSPAHNLLITLAFTRLNAIIAQQFPRLGSGSLNQQPGLAHRLIQQRIA